MIVSKHNSKREIAMGKKARSSGFTLIELAITTAIISIITVLSLQQSAEDLKSKRAAAQGTILKELSDSVMNYATQNQSEILNGAPIAHAGCTVAQCGAALPAGNVANTLAPTLRELIALGYLRSGFKARDLFGVSPGYAFTLTPQPNNCLTAVPQNCVSIEALTHLTHPILTSTGKPDVNAIGEMQLSAGGNSGASITSNNLTFAAYGDRPNPVTAQPLGVVAMMADTVSGTSVDLDPLLPRDGSRPMTGSLDLGNQSLINGNQATFAGRVTAGGITSNGSVVVNNANSSINNGSLTLETAPLSINNASATVTNGSVNVSGGNLNVGNGSVGVTNGNIAMNGGNRTHYINDGINSLDRGVFNATLVKNGQLITKPTCKNGRTPQIFVWPSQFAPGSVSNPIQALETYAENASSTQWRVRLRVLVYPNWITPLDQYHNIVAMTKCS